MKPYILDTTGHIQVKSFRSSSFFSNTEMCTPTVTQDKKWALWDA